MSDYYYLGKNNRAIPCDRETWAAQFEKILKQNKNHLSDEIIDGKRISTIWMGLNHSEIGGPLIFETMVFDKEKGDRDIYCDRYSTWKEAEEGHKKAVQWVKDGCKEEDDNEPL